MTQKGNKQEDKCNTITIDYRLLSHYQNPDALLLYHFQYRSWPEEGNPPSTTGLVYVNDQVQKIQRPSGPSGPVIVHCRWVYMYLELRSVL